MTIEYNNLISTNYKFVLDRAPNVQYRIQQTALPGISLGSAEVSTPFVKLPMPGNLTFDDLHVSFKVSEHMLDYLEIFNWMIQMGQPASLGSIPKLIKDIKSDITLTILNSASQPTINVTFVDAYPVNLTEISFDTTLSTVEYPTATATFKYTYYTIKTIT